MKKVFNSIVMLCMVSTFSAITVFAATVPESVDRYGISISVIDSLRYEKELKAKIKEAPKYTESLYNLLTKHYCMLLENEENVDDYVSFYRECYSKATDPLLKGTFHQRMIRGLFRKGNKEEAEAELKKIDRKIVESNLHELGYYKILLTYQNPEGTAAKKSYDDAISFYETNKLYGFDLASLYNNYGILHEEKEPEKACTLYKKGIRLSDSKTMLSLLLRNVKDVARNNKGMRKGIYQDAFSYLNSLQNNECKMNLMTRMLEIRFFAWDTRRQRQLMDMMASYTEKVQDSVLLYDCYFALADKEDSDGNYADALQLLSRCEVVCRKNGWNNKILLIQTNQIFEEIKLGKHPALEQNVKEILFKIFTSDIKKENKAATAELLSKISAMQKDWKLFDFIIAQIKENELYVCWGQQVVDDLLPAAISSSDFTRDDVVRIAKALNADIISTIPDDQRDILAAYFANINEFDLVKMWQPQKKENDFFTQIVKAETALTRGTPEGYKVGLKILNELQPVPFKVNGKDFTKIDAETLMLCDKLAIEGNMSAIANCVPIVKRLEELIPECSPNFKEVGGALVCGTLGGVYAILGDSEKAIPMLTLALADRSKEDLYYGTWTLNLGLANLQQGNLIDAKKSFETARNIFKEQNNLFMYIRASVNLASVKVEAEDDLKDIEGILTDVIAIATQKNFSDDLCRAYMVMMTGIVKDKRTVRAEKNKKIAELEKKCVRSTDNPTILAAFFAIVAKIKEEDNFPAESVISDIEKYFQYQKLFSDALNSLSEDSFLVQRDKMMQDTLFRLLEEIGDTKKIDYWNKIFERDRTRSVELQSQQAMVDTKMLSVLALISKFENAQQILAHEQSKKESEQDKRLIQKALKLKREIEQQYELARKNLSAKDLKLFEALLSDNFIIHPDSLSQLSSILPTGTACLQFLNVGENIIAYIAVKDTPPFTISISLRDKGLTQKKFSQKLIKVRNLLQNKANVSTVNKELAELYSVLFSEIEKPLEKLNVKSIVVNASGILRYVPMATLYDGKKYLIEKYQVTNITGLDLIRLSKNSGTKTISNVKAAIFADPDGSLPAGRKEGLNIAQFFENKKLYLGDKASLAEFESMVGNVNFVHLATHAVLDPNEPGKSYIQFADGKKWYYSDMMGFNIQNVDSIALSACETAVSEKSTGGEIEGMAYQLLKKSPSGSVLASFWKVDDTATAMLMGIYYKHVTDSIKTNHTLDRGGALREAQLNLLKNPDTSHPYYWAAFTLFGDFR